MSLYPKCESPGSYVYIVGPCEYGHGKYVVARITSETKSGYNIIECNPDVYASKEECQKECDEINSEHFSKVEVEAIKTLILK